MAEQPAVLSTAELLELILSHLPMQDLVTAQLVSQTWKTAIDSSPTLQAALFFRPLATTHDQQFTFNPLLQRVFPHWFKSDPKIIRGPHAMETMSWTTDPSTRNAVLRADASWRRVFPTQPPKATLELAGKKSTKAGHFEINGVIHRPDGIKMGTLYDLGHEAMRMWVSGFWINWAEEGQSTDKIVMSTHHSWFKRHCFVWLGDEFKSEAWEEVILQSVREGTRGMAWYRCFGKGPNVKYGGWRLRDAAVGGDVGTDGDAVSTATAIRGDRSGFVIYWRNGSLPMFRHLPEAMM